MLKSRKENFKEIHQFSTFYTKVIPSPYKNRIHHFEMGVFCPTMKCVKSQERLELFLNFNMFYFQNLNNSYDLLSKIKEFIC